MSELCEIIAHTESQESRNGDKSSSLDIGHNQEIRTVTIGQNRNRNLVGKYAASMLRVPCGSDRLNARQAERVEFA